MEVYSKAFGPAVTNCYVIIDNSTNYAVVIDVPPQSLEYITSILEEHNADLKEIWLTHSHWDHIGDAQELKEKTGADVLINEKDLDRLKTPNKFIGMNLPFDVRAVNHDKLIKEGDELLVGHQKFRVLETPGHTEGGVIFVNDDQKVAFVGDTIFKRSIGRTDLPGGNYETLMKSITNKVMTLPNDYKLCSGHGPDTSVGSEKQFNPFILDYNE